MQQNSAEVALEKRVYFLEKDCHAAEEPDRCLTMATDHGVEAADPTDVEAGLDVVVVEVAAAVEGGTDDPDSSSSWLLI
jgi:hypothetical protein